VRGHEAYWESAGTSPPFLTIEVFLALLWLLVNDSDAIIDSISAK
jgi:hypothetical protein